jgi:PAS domain S-box-containing protein
VFAILAVSVSANAACELLLMHAQTPERFGVILRWRHLPLGILVISIVVYLRLYLRAGSLWLAGGVCALRLLVLAINFSVEPNINFEQITGLRQVTVFGGEIVSAPVGTIRPWKWLTQLSILLFLVFALQASVALWRRGSRDERRRVIVVGGSFALFVMMAAGTGALTHVGVIQVPYLVSLYFLVIVALAGNELSADVVRAAQLTRQLESSESALRENTRRLEEAAAAARTAIWEWDVGRDEIWITDQGRALFGFGPGEQLSLVRFLERVHPEDSDAVRRAVAQMQRGGSYDDIEFRILPADGTTRWMATRGSVDVDAQGKPILMRGISVDITTRKAMESALQESETRFGAMANTAPVMLWMSGADKRYTFFNQSWLDFTGRTQQELSNGWTDDVHREDHDRRIEVHASAYDARAKFTMEYRLRRYDGEYRWILESGVPRYSSDDAFVGYIGSAVDVTERKRSEMEISQQRNELAHLSRVTMLGELSGSLAHELNQPLTAILSNAQAAQRLLARADVDLDEVREILTDIVSDDKRAGEVIHGLRVLLKQGESRHQPLDLNAVVRDVIRLVRSELLNHGVILTTELAPVLPTVVGDRVQLQQVLLNLVVNGYEAMADVSGADRQLTIRTSLSEEKSVCVSVTDVGHGVPAQDLERVFEPFFTTKTHGLGLGLAVCRTIITAQGGALWAANHSPRGATFQFALPAQPAEAE